MNAKSDPFSAVRGPSPSVVAAMFGCPVENVRAQYRKNAAQLEAMASEAEKSGKKVNGYTAGDLRRLAKSALEKANQ